ncbi:MAG: hydroxymethylglutaryl-CoA synthase family protein [Deltaproteobacteria bacterium]|nr:hydroxymethylglutaryl-CoA synthase family protein [Deltaproteobacteria bacterium]
MAGIVSYGAYIPKFRIDRKIIYKSIGWVNPATYLKGEKAVANYDEDAVTMAVAAGMDCLSDIDPDIIDTSYFASTSAIYKERQTAEIISTAFDLRSDIRTADFTDTVKSGTTATLSALDSVQAGTSRNVIVCASDCRVGRPGSAQEELFGDGAASLILGNDNVVADFIGSFSVSYDFVDHWKAEDDKYDRQWEDRFIRDAGYSVFIPEAISGVLKKYNVDPKDLAKVGYPCLYAGDHKKIGKKLGLESSQVQDPLLANVGYTGSSNPLMLLVAALEDAKPGDKIVIASFGTGSDALLFEVTDKINDIKGNRRGIKKHLEAKTELTSYEKMLSFRNILPIEKGIRGEIMPFTPLSELWRLRDQILGLCGTKCKVCGTPQYPSQIICVKPDCGAVGEMEKYRFSQKKGTLRSFTVDHLAFTPSPPGMYGMVDFDGGGRYWFDISDIDPESLSVNMPIEMSFRKKYVDETFAIHAYFWKAVPVMD